MGKKRRYINRPDKFATKAFKFLDKVDGTTDDDLQSDKIDTFVERVTVTDLGNQTFKFTARIMGPGDSGLAGDKVKYNTNSAADDSNNVIAIDSGGSGRDKHTATSAKPAVNSAGAVEVLSPDTVHSVSVQCYAANGNDKQGDPLEQEFTLSTAKVDLSSITATDDGVDIDLKSATGIEVTPADATVSAAGCPAGEVSFDLGTNDGSTKNDLKITMVDKTGADVTFAAAAGGQYTRADGNKTAITTTTTDLNAADLVLKFDPALSTDAAKNPHVITITPRKKDATEITADAVTISITVS